MSPDQHESENFGFNFFHHRHTFEFLKTTLLHLLGIFILCYLYQGFFLIWYPPLCLVWILCSLILSGIHLRIHQRVASFYFRESLLTQIWLNPLALLGIAIGSTFLTFAILDFLDMAILTRQVLQLSVEIFSKFLYVYFLLLFASSTFLFVELCILWIPRLQPFHFTKSTRSTARKFLLILVALFIGGTYTLFTLQYENVLYIKALLILNLSNDSQRTVQLLDQIPPRRESLYLNAQYRIGKILQKRFHRYEEAISRFQIILKASDSPLRDSSVLQILTCIFQSGGSAQRMQQIIESTDMSSSCLIDEMQFLLAAKYEMEGELEQARILYKKMALASFFRFTLNHSFNARRPSYERTATLARRKLLSLTYLST